MVRSETPSSPARAAAVTGLRRPRRAWTIARSLVERITPLPLVLQHHDLGAELHAIEQVDDVGVEQAHAARRLLAPDELRVIGPVDAVDGVDVTLVEIEGTGTHGV